MWLLCHPAPALQTGLEVVSDAIGSLWSMMPSDTSEPGLAVGPEDSTSGRLDHAWRLSNPPLIRVYHSTCASDLADLRLAVDLAREELRSEDPDPRAASDIVLLLHNLIVGLLAHGDCDEEHVAEALGRVDEVVDRQARLLVRALDIGDAREIAENRWVLEDECGLRAEVRQRAGLEGW